MIKTLIKKIFPKGWLLFYHQMLAVIAAFFYRYPSRKLIVIGVTGTNGKTTVCHMIRDILEAAGNRVGMTTSIAFTDGRKSWENNTKQGMPGRFQLRKLLDQMVSNQCKYAVIETTSEGIKQFRHYQIDYNIAVLTNLTRDHIEAHGSFEAYRQAKEELFKIVSLRKGGSTVINLDDQNKEAFLRFKASKIYGYSVGPHRAEGTINVLAESIKMNGQGSQFNLTVSPLISQATSSLRYQLPVPGEHNIYNALAAICVGLAQKIKEPTILKALACFRGISGRLEEIKNKKGFRVFVDYAHTEDALEKVYKTIAKMSPRKIIAVLGATGGGRDQKKRPLLGRLAAQYADLVLVTNEDPYDEDPQRIIDAVFEGVAAEGKVEGQNCWRVLDREQAIKKALKKASKGDIVIITGKGCERVMAVRGGMIPWDDREVVRKFLRQDPVEDEA